MVLSYPALSEARVATRKTVFGRDPLSTSTDDTVDPAVIAYGYKAAKCATHHFGSII